MKYRYIAMEREYGSGGREIARQTAQAAGIPCYGREILEEAARNLNLPAVQIEDMEEKASNSLMYSLYMVGKMHAGDGDMVSGEGKVYMAELAVIRDLAAEGPAIFVGRCAASALEDKKGVLKVFIHADMPFRVERAVSEYGVDRASAETVLRRCDKRRAGYYHTCTARKWNDISNYHLILDSGKLGLEKCAEILAGML